MGRSPDVCKFVLAKAVFGAGIGAGRQSSRPKRVGKTWGGGGAGEIELDVKLERGHSRELSATAGRVQEYAGGGAGDGRGQSLL